MLTILLVGCGNEEPPQEQYEGLVCSQQESKVNQSPMEYKL